MIYPIMPITSFQVEKMIFFFFKSMNSIRNLWLARSGIHFRVYTFWLGTINLLRFFFYVSHILKTISSYLHIFECHFPNPSNMFFFFILCDDKRRTHCKCNMAKRVLIFFFWFANTSDISFVLPISLLFFHHINGRGHMVLLCHKKL